MTDAAIDSAAVPTAEAGGDGRRRVLIEFAPAVGGFAIVPSLQTRLMDVAADAQALAAALNHSAFNIANAPGARFGGTTIAAVYGWTSTGWVALERRSKAAVA